MQEDCCGKGRFGLDMDPRLGALITPWEFEQAIHSANSEMLKHSPHRFLWSSAGVGVAFFTFIWVVVLFNVYQPAYYDCAGPYEACSAWCCAHGIHIMNLDFVDARCEIYNGDVTRDQISEGCGCIADGCFTQVRLEGRWELAPAENRWALVVAGLGGFAGFALFLGILGTLIFKRCSLHSKLLPHFHIWISRGIYVRYHPGRKAYPPRLIVTVPSVQSVLLGAAQSSQTMPLVAHAVEVAPLWVPQPREVRVVRVQPPAPSAMQVLMPSGHHAPLNLS